MLLIEGYAADEADGIGFLGNNISMMQEPFAIETLSNTIRQLLEGSSDRRGLGEQRRKPSKRPAA